MNTSDIKPVIENDLLYLRKITDNDTDMILKWRNSEKVMNNFVYRTPLTKEVHENWLRTKVDTGKVYQFIVGLKETKNGTAKEIGCTYLQNILPKSHYAEFGFFFGDELEPGKGIGYYAQHLTLLYGYRTLGINKYEVRIFEDNIASIKTNIKNGFKIIENKYIFPDRNAPTRKMVFLEMDAREVF